MTVDVPAAAPGAPVAVASTGTASPRRVDVDVLDHGRAEQIGGVGVAARIASADRERPDGQVDLTMDYNGFRHVYGGDFADRLRIAELPECALDRPTEPDCVRPAVLPGNNDTKAGRLTARVDAVATPKLYVLITAASGDAGDYRATDMKPSGKWAAGLASGDFTYSYPLTLPVPPYGKAPDLALRYSSGSVDGRTSASNNQASWVGLGWDLTPGYIERRYRNCPDDNSPLLSDLCWHSPYSGDEDGAAYVISLGGTTTELLRTADSSYRMRDDQGWRLEHKFDGQNSDNSDEYWIVTDGNGTRYRFGYREDANFTVPVVGDDAGEPCKNSEWCRQTWRWGLDQIADGNDNLTNLFWTKETNYYKRWNNGDKLSYDRGGYLDRIDYGMRGTERPMVQVDFTTGYRCASDVAIVTPNCAAPTSSSTEAEYPDVPRDLICAGGQDCKKYTPSFFVARRLTGIVTKVWDPRTAAYLEVNRYQPTFAFVNPAGPTDPMLWLNYLQASGKFGDAVTMPVVDFDGTWLNNRVDYPSGDLTKALPFRRLTKIRNGLGGKILITYGHASPAATCPSNGADSTWESGKNWDTNDQECYRQEFKPEGASKTKGVFHKYVTTKVELFDMVGGSPTQTTTYAYTGKAAWHHDDDLVAPSDQQTWTDWRGYPTVRTTEGTGPNDQRSITDSTFFRGMDGDKTSSGTRTVTITDYAGKPYPDNHAKAGKLLQEQAYRLNADGTTTEIAATRHTYWDSGITANGPGLHNAHMIRTLDTFHRDLRAAGTFQETSSTDDGYSTGNGGLATRKVDWGEAGALDDQCTEIRYAQNTADGRWMLNFPESQEQHSGGPDGQSGECPGPVVSRIVTLYDGATVAGPATNKPTSGNVTDTRRYWTDTSFASDRSGYDVYGRVVSATDPVNATTTTSYTPPSGWPTDGVVSTNALGHKTTTYLSRAWGKPVRTVDPNGLVISQDYDGMGRIQRVWLASEPRPTGPDIPPPGGAIPSYEFTYHMTFTGTDQPTKPTVVTSKQLQKIGGPSEFLYSYSYFDGQSRVREIQTPSPGPDGGRTVVVTSYDDRGLAKGTSRPLWNSTAPADNPDLMLNPAVTAIPSWTEKTYDSLGREKTSTLFGLGQPKAVTTTANYGDGKVVTPARGGRIAYWNDARDRLATVQENLPAGSDAPSPTAATTTYAYNTRGDMITVVDAAGNRSEYKTDWLGRRTQAKDPDAGSSTAAYDPAGHIVATTDAVGTKVSNTYDVLGRKRFEWAGDVGGTKLAEWTFDSLPGALGKAVAETRYTNGDAYTAAVTGYDARYRTTGRTYTVPASENGLAGSYHYDYTYDSADHQTSITYPAAGNLPAETVTTVYAPTGVPTTLTGAATYVNSVTYAGSGQLNNRVIGSVERKYSYEAAGAQRLSSVQTLVGGAVAQSDVYGYDPANNVTGITDQTTSQSQCHTYDPLQRLTGSWTTTAADCGGGIAGADSGGPDPYKLEYTHDAVGNMTSIKDKGATETFSYPAPGPDAVRPHAVAAVGGDTFGYNSQGQLTSRTVAGRGSVLAWDEQDRLASVTTGGATSAFVYAADSTRLIRRDPTISTLYLDGMEVRAASSGTSAVRYYMHGTALVAMRSSIGKLTWLGNDVQGTVQVAVDATTNAVSRQRYLPFGAHRGDRDDIPDTDRGFLGKVEDPSGLVQVGARYYDPVIGKFISTDPLYDMAKPQTINPYTYAASNPTTYSDPTGLKLCDGNTGENRCEPGQRPDGKYAPPREPPRGWWPNSSCPLCVFPPSSPAPPVIAPPVIAPPAPAPAPPAPLPSFLKTQPCNFVELDRKDCGKPLLYKNAEVEQPPRPRVCEQGSQTYPATKCTNPSGPRKSWGEVARDGGRDLKKMGDGLARRGRNAMKGAIDGATYGGVAGLFAGCAVGAFVGAGVGTVVVPVVGTMSGAAGGCINGGGVGTVGGGLVGGFAGAIHGFFRG